MNIDLTGKVALVTGGTGGIGTAICLELAAAGASLISNYRNQKKAREWQQKMKDDGIDVKIYQVDVVDHHACKEMVRDITANLGPIDILVNNAGITEDASFKRMSKTQWDRVIDINLNSLFNVTRQVVIGMMGRGWGRIINISSINGQKGQFGQTNYAASKAGMHGFTMSLAQETASKGVTVNTVSPGYIATDMVMAVPEAIRQKIITQIPVGRLGKATEVASLVGFLCSDKAGFITGADFAINGGQHMM